VERRAIAWFTTGDRLPIDRKNASSQQASFFSLKGEIGAALKAIGIVPDWKASTSPASFYHPTRQAEVSVDGAIVGHFGQIHPDTASILRLPEDTFLAELDIDSLIPFAADAPQLRPLSRHPSVRRDISLEIDVAVPYSVIEAAVKAAAGALLERQWLFDVFTGASIDAGRHSLGIALQLRKLDGTFTDEAANQVRDAVVAALVELGGNMRS
jgi:phenylalanyl-tRNA synthetase beta chain